MFIKRNISWKILWRLSWKELLIFLLWTTLCFAVYFFLGWTTIDIPYEPLSLVGIAVSFYIGFKNSQSYDRFWEARKIWGGVVNYSRTWANQVINLVADNTAVKQQLIYRHLAWINALRIQLRKPTSFSLTENKAMESIFERHGEKSPDFEMLSDFLSESEFKQILNRKNIATHLVKNQAAEIKKLVSNESITEFDKAMLHGVLEELYNLQGRSERIKNTPFPRQYAYLSLIFVWIFVLLLPLGLLNIYELQIENIDVQSRWWFLVEMIPLSILVSWVFVIMEKIGSNSEDPFEGRMSDVPMNALCRSIEVDLKDMLDETNLPPIIVPKDNILY